MSETIMAPKRETKPPLVWSVSGLLRFEVSDDVLPKDVDYMEKLLVVAIETLRRKAEWNAWSRFQCDPIYMGM